MADPRTCLVWLEPHLLGGIDDFFADIGRIRCAGRSSPDGAGYERRGRRAGPEPFPPPADVERIETQTVFSRLEG